MHIAWGSYVHPDTKIGRYTRINNISHIGKCEIGSFCAIGGRLVIRDTNHNTNYLNIQDHFQNKVLGSNHSVVGKSKGPIIIGHGVWIGDSAIILSGVTIGNGVVIGAGSVVTKPIPDFAVAVGNPAKVIKYRFNEEIRSMLSNLTWWTWDIHKIKKHRHIFDLDFNDLTIDEIESIINSTTI